jgi:hypothetical protein
VVTLANARPTLTPAHEEFFADRIFNGWINHANNVP